MTCRDPRDLLRCEAQRPAAIIAIVGDSDNQGPRAPFSVGQGFGYDAIVIGTGFGGAVTAARLTQAGARVFILERGMRYAGEAFPALPRDGQVVADMARYVWSTDEGRLGLWDVRDLDATHTASAAGYGGGSLIYAGVHLRAPREVFESWPQTADHPYTREALDPYYDLAAHMLEVDTIESSPTLYPLRKASALRAAAAELGRSEQAFSPPLAVRFAAKKDRHGTLQPACVGCGECNSGCRHGSKNTLDQNYLAIAERARAGEGEIPRARFRRGRAARHGEPLAVVRTLAEARTIERIQRGGVAGFCVELLDHTALDHSRAKRHQLDEVTAPRTEHVTARFVFVCAGVVGSTELLLRNRERLAIASRRLGEDYFGNSDAIGIVRNAAHVHQPHVGPVITTALVHRGQKDDEPWLMIQDGGYGAAVHAMVEAVFASPVLAQRNRFYESALRIAPPYLGPEPKFPEPYRDPAAPVRRNASLAEGLYHAEMAHELTGVIPKQLAAATIALRQRAEGFVSADVEKTVDALEQYVVGGGALRVARRFEGTALHECMERVARVALTWLARFVRKLTATGALAALERDLAGQPFVREHAIGVATTRMMKDRFKLHDQRVMFVEGLKLLTRHIGDAARYEKSLDHTAVLLTMGRDHQHHRLRLKNGALHAEMDKSQLGESRLYSVQERLLREVASVLGGELRLNPAWSQAHTPITVHGQGGCGMAVDQAHGVTNPYGEVYGCAGLFVMDAAVFPRPVGVNPSATILAVVERNIEAFIRARLGLRDFVAPEAAAARGIDAGRRALLTPKAIDSPHATKTIDAKPVGICFDERMYGFHSSLRNAKPGELDKLDGTGRTERLYSEHEACDIEGRLHEDALELALQVEITDLPAFLADPLCRGKLSGTLHLLSRDPSNANIEAHLRGRLTAAGGSLEIADGEVQILARAGPHERVFRYSMTFKSPAPGGKDLMLEGHKRVRDEPGQDEWQDSTALFFRLAEIDGIDRKTGKPIASKTAYSHGIVRVALGQFAYAQLPSIKVINVGDAPGSDQPDPATVLWSTAAFGKFFLGNLTDVYLKEAALVTRVVKRSLSLDGVEP